MGQRNCTTTMLVKGSPANLHGYFLSFTDSLPASAVVSGKLLKRSYSVLSETTNQIWQQKFAKHTNTSVWNTGFNPLKLSTTYIVRKRPEWCANTSSYLCRACQRSLMSNEDFSYKADGEHWSLMCTSKGRNSFSLQVSSRSNLAMSCFWRNTVTQKSI